jgi:CsoR family transcriptional regulator, copper-sensing transcriptional repressor
MTNCCSTRQHPDHTPHQSRLNRVAGQVEGIKKMVAERRYCVDIMVQLRATRAALKAIELEMLETHLEHCVVQTFDSADKTEQTIKINELKDLLKKFGD